MDYASLGRNGQGQEADGELRLSATKELFAWDCHGQSARQFGWGSEDEQQYFSRAPLGRGHRDPDAGLRRAVARMVREPMGIGHQRLRRRHRVLHTGTTRQEWDANANSSEHV